MALLTVLQKTNMNLLSIYLLNESIKLFLNFFRGFIQERAWQKEQGKPVGETHLYFGCRNKDKDFIYREELEKFVEDEVLTLHTAFSRDQEKKVYVTDRLREHMDNLWHLIGKKGAHVYVRAHHMFSRILKFTIFKD